MTIYLVRKAFLKDRHKTAVLAKVSKLAYLHHSYKMTYRQACAWHVHGQQLMPFFSPVQSKPIPFDIQVQIAVQLTSLSMHEVTDLANKMPSVYNIKLKECSKYLTTYTHRASTRWFYKQAPARKKSTQLMQAALDKALITSVSEKPEQIQHVIGSLKGHLAATLKDHRQTSALGCFSFLTTPALAKTYRQALSLFPQQEVEQTLAFSG